MTRVQLEHLIWAAADIADANDIVIIGSQAILGQFPDAPAELLISVEADMTPKNHPERWELIDGSIGELSPFHTTFGYYAQGVEPGTAVLPRGWESRLVPISNANTRGAVGLCLDAHDLVVAKAIAGREKDLTFIEAAARHNLVRSSTLLDRLAETTVDEARRRAAEQRIRRLSTASQLT